VGKRKTSLPSMKNSFFGYVIGTAMQKTIKVRVERIKMHPIVKKVTSINPASQNAQELLGP
jgi:ribosomal protein S17